MNECYRMKNLLDIYENVFNSNDQDQLYRWWYYPSLTAGCFGRFDDYRIAFGRVASGTDSSSSENIFDELIKTIYHTGEKETFFRELVDDISERSAHMVSAFFLGHFFVRNLDIFSELACDPEFPWLWFLCCLYHDVYFKNEKIRNKKYLRPRYYKDSKYLLYDKGTIENYRKIRSSEEKDDHGIYAAAALSHHYYQLYSEKGNKKDEIAKLFINGITLKSVNCIAKVIASHNVFVAKPEDIQNYRDNNLNVLISSENHDPRMPKHIDDRFEQLYLLLSLVDTLEPLKRGIQLKDVLVGIKNKSEIELRISGDIENGVYEKYRNNVEELKTWLNYVRISAPKNDRNRCIKIFITGTNSV